MEISAAKDGTRSIKLRVATLRSRSVIKKSYGFTANFSDAKIFANRTGNVWNFCGESFRLAPAQKAERSIRLKIKRN